MSKHGWPLQVHLVIFKKKTQKIVKIIIKKSELIRVEAWAVFPAHGTVSETFYYRIAYSRALVPRVLLLFSQDLH